MPKIALIGTGGSISTRGLGALDLVEYGDHGHPLLAPQDLLEKFPELDQLAAYERVHVRSLRSTAIAPSDWLALRETIVSTVNSVKLDGVVITHGTSTLEDTSYFLSLTTELAVPIVLVGAQRPPSGLSSDSGINLVNAVRAALAAKEAGLAGVMVAVNSEIHLPRYVTKASNYALNTFTSAPFGPIGIVEPDGEVRFDHGASLPRDPLFSVEGLSDLPRVDIAYSYAGSDGANIRAFVERGTSGIICAGLPPGKVTPAEWDEVLKARERGIIVVQASRASGATLERARLRNAGVIAAGPLNPQKARILTLLALTRSSSVDAVRKYFRDACLT